MKKGEMRILNSKSMFNRCKLKRLVIEDSHEKDEVDFGRNGNVRNRDEEQEDDGNSDNTFDSGIESTMTTSRGRASYNRCTQQNDNGITISGENKALQGIAPPSPKEYASVFLPTRHDHGLGRIIRRRYMPRYIAIYNSPTQVRDRQVELTKVLQKFKFAKFRI